MDLRYRFGAASKWLPLLVAGAVIGAVLAFAVSNAQPRIYEAKATLIVGQALEALNPDVNQLIVSQRLSSTYAAIATKRPALEHVIGQLGLKETPDQLGRRVWAEAPTDSTLLTLMAQDTDPAAAAAIANELAELLIASSPAIQGLDSELQASIEAEIKATREQIQITQARVERLVDLREPATRRAGHPRSPAGPARHAALVVRVAARVVCPERGESPHGRRAGHPAHGRGVAEGAAQHPPGLGGRPPARRRSGCAHRIPR